MNLFLAELPLRSHFQVESFPGGTEGQEANISTQNIILNLKIPGPL